MCPFSSQKVSVFFIFLILISYIYTIVLNTHFNIYTYTIVLETHYNKFKTQYLLGSRHTQKTGGG